MEGDGVQRADGRRSCRGRLKFGQQSIGIQRHCRQRRMLRVLGRKTLENEILKEAVAVAHEKN
jgi:hypothetical protein